MDEDAEDYELSAASNYVMPPSNTTAYANYCNFGGIRNGFNNLERGRPCMASSINSITQRHDQFPRSNSDSDPDLNMQDLPRCPISTSPVCNCNGQGLCRGLATPSGLVAESTPDSMKDTAGYSFLERNHAWEHSSPKNDTPFGHLQQAGAFEPCPRYHIQPVENTYVNQDQQANTPYPNGNPDAALRFPAPSTTPSPSEGSSDSSSYHTAPTVLEQRYGIVHHIYHTCLEAAASHLHHLASRPLCTNRRRQRRYSPYTLPEPRASTLMDQISRICTHMWRRARADVMAPHRAESQATRNMHDLFVWGETIVRGLEDQDVGEQLEDMDLGEVQNLTLRAAIAGARFCACLHHREGVLVCEEARRRLGELIEVEKGEEAEGEIL